ncbi:zinc ribbon domain-containing protein, partial [Brevundimonas sp. UBA7534]|uniref:zinc ribbon domain-containing protein n=1 Tax=Brevundimonas sp. UBA7534 TaxID=1946138 RepID=UPI0039C87962
MHLTSVQVDYSVHSWAFYPPAATLSAQHPKRLLSGLLKCGLCGAGMTLNSAKYACSAARERGTRSNNKIIAAQTVEARVL